jgi:peptide/nickel transport system ATP-binding protein
MGAKIDITKLDVESNATRAVRGGSISIVFQEPMISLSPLHTIGYQNSEALHLHRDVSKPEGRELTQDMLRLACFPELAGAASISV